MDGWGALGDCKEEERRDQTRTCRGFSATICYRNDSGREGFAEQGGKANIGQRNKTLTLRLLQGKLYIRGDSKIFRFQNGKSESLFLQRKNPRRIAWTVLYRRQHRKGITEVRT